MAPFKDRIYVAQSSRPYPPVIAVSEDHKCCLMSSMYHSTRVPQERCQDFNIPHIGASKSGEGGVVGGWGRGGVAGRYKLPKYRSLSTKVGTGPAFDMGSEFGHRQVSGLGLGPMEVEFTGYKP